MKVKLIDGTIEEFDYRNPEHVEIFKECDRRFAETLPSSPFREDEVMFFLPEVKPSSVKQ